MDLMHKRLSEALNLELLDSNEFSTLNELVKGVIQDNDSTAEKVAIAALKFSLGDQSLLLNEDESWLSNAVQKGRRNERVDDRGFKARRSARSSSLEDENMERFKVDVGRRDRVKPGNLVGAIANEAGLKGRMIGRIQIFESHSLIDLPKGMPDDLLRELKRVKVMNKELNIQRNK